MVRMVILVEESEKGRLKKGNKNEGSLSFLCDINGKLFALKPEKAFHQTARVPCNTARVKQYKRSTLKNIIKTSTTTNLHLPFAEG